MFTCCSVQCPGTQPNVHAKRGLKIADWAPGTPPFFVCGQSEQQDRVPSNPGISNWGLGVIGGNKTSACTVVAFAGGGGGSVDVMNAVVEEEEEGCML